MKIYIVFRKNEILKNVFERAFSSKEKALEAKIRWEERREYFGLPDDSFYILESELD